MPDQSALQHWHWFTLVAMVESNNGQVHWQQSYQEAESISPTVESGLAWNLHWLIEMAEAIYCKF